MLKLGMPTLIETETLDQCAALCARLGLDFVELNMNLPQYQPGAIDTGRFKALADRYGIFYTIHLDENLNVSDFNPYIAEGYRRTVTETIRLAKDLGVGVLNMHLSRGVHFTMPEGKVYLFAAYRDRYLQAMADFRDRCEEAVGGSGITICVENCDGFTDCQKEALDILLGSAVFGLTFDIGHDHCCGGRDEGYILAHSDRLRHFHIHDARDGKAHLPLGEGRIDLPRYLAMARALHCGAVLETKTVAGLEQSVRWINSHL